MSERREQAAVQPLSTCGTTGAQCLEGSDLEEWESVPKKPASPSVLGREVPVQSREVAELLCHQDRLLLVSPAARAADTRL